MQSIQKLIWPILLLGFLALLFIACGARQPAANPGGDVEAASPQQVAQPDQLPKHPLEHMGIAGLTPSIGMLDNAVTEAQAVDIVTEYTWGTYRDELVKNYPPSAVPAVYDAKESVTGPSAEGRPVWVVTLEGWGPPVPCAAPDIPPGPEDPDAQHSSRSASQDECTPGKSNAHVIVDAVSGQILAGWHYGPRGGQ
jgi:hypothetical protein